MENYNRDSSNVYYTLDEACIIGKGCQIHTHKHSYELNNSIGIAKYNYDITNSEFDHNFNYFITNSGQLIKAEKPVKLNKLNVVEKKTITFRASDTIKINDLKYLYKGDLQLASEFIVIPAKKEIINNEREMNYATTGFIACFMALFTFIYMVRSFSQWYDMTVKIKKLIKAK